MPDLHITWEKCHHGVEKRNYCEECCKERDNLFTTARKTDSSRIESRIPIKRGCPAAGPCFCSGICQDIIGYRDPLFPGEKP